MLGSISNGTKVGIIYPILVSVILVTLYWFAGIAKSAADNHFRSIVIAEQKVLIEELKKTQQDVGGINNQITGQRSQIYNAQKQQELIYEQQLEIKQDLRQILNHILSNQR